MHVDATFAQWFYKDNISSLHISSTWWRFNEMIVEFILRPIKMLVRIIVKTGELKASKTQG